MKISQKPQNEEQRLKQLYELNILDTPEEYDFDEIVQLATNICKVPISHITFVDADRQFLKAKVGIEYRKSERSTSFCSHVVGTGSFFEIPDTLKDHRFFDNPLVTNDPGIRFYAGYPLISSGYTIGSLCVIDIIPRKLTDEQSFALKVLSNQVIKLLELRLRNLEVEKQLKALQSHKEQLQELSDTQSQIISYIAHDVRSPLASLKGIIDLNDLKVLTPNEIDEHMNMLNNQLDGTLEMLTNLIEWGQAQIHRKIPHIRGVDVYRVVEREIKNMDMAAQLKGNKLVQKVEKGFSVIADEYLLRFVLRNFLSNSNKFTSNGVITISASRLGDQALISVTDTGVGITETIMKKLFSSNQHRSTTPGTNNEKGSGLGLALAKEFIEKLGSTLLIKSEVNKGTTLSFMLPIA